jgi:hypothetical protein
VFKILASAKAQEQHSLVDLNIKEYTAVIVRIFVICVISSLLYISLKLYKPTTLPKRDGVTGEWRKLLNEELNDLYSLPNIVRVVKSRRMRWAGHVARMGEDRGVHRVLVGKPEGRMPLGRPRRRWEDNIKMDL